jgi:hypothetical protein
MSCLLLKDGPVPKPSNNLPLIRCLLGSRACKLLHIDFGFLQHLQYHTIYIS